MAALSVTDTRLPEKEIALFEAGALLTKVAAGDPEPAYALAGRLYLSASGWLLMSVPNSFARGVFMAMDEPGVELPPADPSGQFNAHVSVMSPTEIKGIGGPEMVTERGKAFAYTLGRLYSVEPEGWPDMAKVWFVRVHSPELQNLRRSYGLSGLPHEGRHDFHISVAVRRKKVLGRNDTAKGG